MISVPEAKSLIRLHTQSLASVQLPLSEAAGCMLAADVVAPYNVPFFAQAAMDGYAFAYDDWNKKPLRVQSIIAAGDVAGKRLAKGEAMRIFTGAALPAGADTVVMQEKTICRDKELIIEDETLAQGANVRPVGSEIKAGAEALQKGTLLVPGAVGFLAMLGLAKVAVVPKPKVALIITGNELQAPGKPPEPGKVYEANTFSLIPALVQMGITPVMVDKAGDSLEQTKKAIGKAVAVADMVLLTGGVSVGDYDFVLPAAPACGVQTIFHKVAQKPGKPLFFGKAVNTLVFGLPGNPASVLTCFYQYVVLALEVLMQRNNLQQVIHLTLGASVEKVGGLTYFLKGKIEGGAVHPLPAQESFRLSSFAIADCIIELPEKTTQLEAGAAVKVYRL